MRVHDLEDPDGRVFAFEVSNFMLRRRGVRRVALDAEQNVRDAVTAFTPFRLARWR